MGKTLTILYRIGIIKISRFGIKHTFIIGKKFILFLPNRKYQLEKSKRGYGS